MRNGFLLLLWLASDLLLFVALYAAAYFLRVGFIFSTDFPFDRFLTATILVAPLWLMALATTRTFALLRTQASAKNAAYITYASALGVALFSLAYYFLYGVFFSRLLLVYAFALTTVGILIWHTVFQRFQRAILRMGHPTYPTLIIGVTRESKRLIEMLNRNRSPLKPVAILDGRGAKESDIAGIPVEGKLNKLEETLEKFNITHLIQCSDLEQSLNLLSACRSKGITYMLLPSVLGIVERDERVDRLEGQPVTIVSPRSGWWGWFFQ